MNGTEQADNFNFRPIGVVRSCYRAKFGIPRQPGLIREARGEIVLLPPCNQPEALRGLEDFSHIWVIFVFNENLRQGWKATVRPPRLGGDRRLGVFATRAPFRPVPIGLSAMRLEGIRHGEHGRLSLEVSGLDLVDGTPVLDIKPYLPYTDIISDATGGFAADAPSVEALEVSVSPVAEKQFAKCRPDFRTLCLKVIAADPRPAYQREPDREYQCFLEDREVIWKVDAENPLKAEIVRLEYASGKRRKKEPGANHSVP
jgi:tRNA-Thr(GGU) m(6)t(6)A37 methyltransferase TsaA